MNIIHPCCWPHAHGSRNNESTFFQAMYLSDSFADLGNTEQDFTYSTVNLAKLRLIFGKKHVKLIFVAKCSKRCQETTIWNPPESLGGGPPFYARKVFCPRAIL